MRSSSFCTPTICSSLCSTPHLGVNVCAIFLAWKRISFLVIRIITRKGAFNLAIKCKEIGFGTLVYYRDLYVDGYLRAGRLVGTYRPASGAGWGVVLKAIHNPKERFCTCKVLWMGSEEIVDHIIQYQPDPLPTMKVLLEDVKKCHQEHWDKNDPINMDDVTDYVYGLTEVVPTGSECCPRRRPKALKLQLVSSASGYRRYTIGNFVCAMVAIRGVVHCEVWSMKTNEVLDIQPGRWHGFYHK